jgi:hypothetical protein
MLMLEGGAVSDIERERIRSCIEACICPFCGRGPWKKLPVHTYHAHATDQKELRRMAGLSARDSISSSDHVALMRDRAESDPRFKAMLPLAWAANVLRNGSPEEREAAQLGLAAARKNPTSKAKRLRTLGYLPKPNGPLPSNDPRHGTINAYTNLKCRCVACTEANAERTRAFRERRAAQKSAEKESDHG